MASRIAVLGAGALAIVCCFGLPAIGAALGGLTVGAVVGVAAGVVSAAVLGVATVLWVRSRRQRRRADARR